MILYSILPTYSLLFFGMTIFRNSTQDETKFIIYGTIPSRWYSRKFEKIEGTRVWKIEYRIGIVKLGDSSEEVETWLSSIEDIGQKKYWVKFQDKEFWGQKLENWIKHAGEE